MTELTHGDTLRELTPARHAELLRAEERLKWLNEHPDVVLRRSLCGPWWCLVRGDKTVEQWTVAAVIDLAMAADAGGAKGKEAEGG